MSWNDKIDILDKLTRIAAVVVAGWYVSFWRDRIFVPRLQVGLSGKFLEKGGRRYVLVKMQIKNAGSLIAEIREVGTCLKITPLRRDSGGSAPEGFTRDDTQSFSVLKRYTVIEGASYETVIGRIEPGAVISEQKLIDVHATEYDHLELELRVVTHRSMWRISRRLLPKKWVTNRSFSAVALPDADDASLKRGKVDQSAEEERE